MQQHASGRPESRSSVHPSFLYGGLKSAETSSATSHHTVSTSRAWLLLPPASLLRGRPSVLLPPLMLPPSLTAIATADAAPQPHLKAAPAAAAATGPPEDPAAAVGPAASHQHHTNTTSTPTSHQHHTNITSHHITPHHTNTTSHHTDITDITSHQHPT